MRNLKKALALVLAMAMSLSLAVTAGAAYKDGDKISAEYEVAVEVASQLGILEGFEDGTYGPQKNLTRAQLATMTYRLATGDVEDKYTADFAGGAAAAFTDTAATAWYAGYVGYAADAGYLKGVGEGLYKPNSAMTGYQALAAFLRVVGYNQPGQFTGADWTVQVAMIANEIGALKGIEGVDLNAAISREVAAQIIYNVLFAQNVDYTPAFGYQDIWGDHSQAKDEFGIVRYDADAVTAPWGQPAQEWYNSKGEALVSVAYAPVAEYTVAVDECDLAKDLGLTKVTAPAQQFRNGVFNDDVVIANVDPKDTVNTVGAQGTLTEVYDIDGDLWFVQIETFLGQIGKTTAATYDKNGHELTAATAALNVFAERDCAINDDTVETDAFAEKDYVLINYSFMDNKDDNNKDYGYYLTKTAPVATAELTVKNLTAETSVIGGKTYNWAEHYHWNNPGVLETEYNVFVDFYGNLIGLFELDPADPVYTILDGGWAKTVAYDSYVAGKIVDLTSGALEDIEICSYDKIPFWTDKFETKVHDIVSYEVCEDGYEMKKVGTEGFGYYIEKGVNNIVVGDKLMGVDANTIFAVETEHGQAYDIYVGYENVPSMAAFASIETFNADATGEDADNFLDIVYVDATSASFFGEDMVAYIMADSKIGDIGVLANGVQYVTFSDVVVNGEVVDVMCVPGFNLSADLWESKIITLKTNADGLVYAAEGIFGYDVKTVDGISGNDVTIGTINYKVTTDTIIWVVDEAEGTAYAGSAADIEKGDNILFKMADFNKFDTIIVRK